MNDLMKLLCCPLCKKGLIVQAKGLVCQSCSCTYPIIDGIPYLLPPLLQQDMKQIKEIYEQSVVAKRYGKEEACTGSVYYHKKLRKRAVRLAIRTTKRNALLVEVGCGNGLILSEILHQRPDIQLVGLDFSLAMIKEARARLGKNVFFVVGSADALPFMSHSFDGVLCIDTLKNLPTERHLITAVGELLRIAKGVLVIECVIKTAWDSVIRAGYELLQTVSMKKKVEKTPLAGIVVTKISMKKIINVLSNKQWKTYKVSHLLPWRIFLVR